MNKRSGFTIIELLVVVAIVGILASFGMDSFRTLQKKSQRNEARTHLMLVALAQQEFYYTNRRYAAMAELDDDLSPATNETLQRNVNKYFTLALSINDDGYGFSYKAQRRPEHLSLDPVCKELSVTQATKSASDESCWNN